MVMMPNANQTTTMHTTTQELTKMATTKLPSISKDVPKLSTDSRKMWKYQLELNTRQCDDDLGRLIFDNPNNLLSDDINGLRVTLTGEEKEALEKYEKFVDAFTKKEGASKLMGHAHADIVKTLEDEDKQLVMDIAYPDPVGVYTALISEYRINTRQSRTTKLKEFINMELDKDGTTLAQFVQSINSEAVDFNAMAAGNTDLRIGDELKTVVLLEGVRAQHEHVYRNVLEIIEQTPGKLTYKDAVTKLKPVARRYEMGEESAKKAVAKAAATTDPAKEEQICYDYAEYGECRFGSKCRWKHAAPGTKRCTNCNGKHRPSRCTSKPTNNTQKANVAAEVKAQVTAAVKEQMKKVKQHKQAEQQEQANAAKQQAKASKAAKAKAAKEPQKSYFPDSDSDDYGSDPESANIAAERNTGESTKAESSSWSPMTLFLLLVTTVTSLLNFTQRRAGGHGHVSALAFGMICVIAFLAMFPGGVSSTELFGPPRVFEHSGQGQCSNTADVCMMSNVIGHRVKMKWTIDSGCTSHITNDRKSFDKQSIIMKSTKIETANGNYMHSPFMGNVTVRVRDGTGTVKKLQLDNVLYTPDASSNLISVARLMQSHHRLVFDNNVCTIWDKVRNTKTVSQLQRNLFEVEQNATKEMEEEAAMVADSSQGLTKTQLWHNRVCHYSDRYVRKAVPADQLSDDKVEWCEACVQGGIQRRAFSQQTNTDTAHTTPRKYKFSESDPPPHTRELKTQERLDIIKADTCQPFSNCPSTAKSKYFFLFVDVHTRKKWIRFGKNKSDLNREFKEWLGYIEVETGTRPKLFAPDGGGEFDNNDLLNHLKKQHILFEISCTDCPNQNAIVERANGVVLTHIHKLLAQSGLPNKYWEDAGRFSIEVSNAMPVKTRDWVSPNKAWNPGKCDKTLQRVRTFGCEAWYVVPKAHRRKGDGKARKGVYLGTSLKHKGWKILDLESRKIVNSRDVYFHENRFPFRENKDTRAAPVVAAENNSYLYLPTAAAQRDEHDDFEMPEDQLVHLPDAEDYDEPAADSQPRNDQPRRSSRLQVADAVDYSSGSNLKTKLRNVDGSSVNVGYSSHPEEIVLPAGQSDVVSDSENAAVAVDLGQNFKTMTRVQILAGPYREQFLEAERRELECLKIHGTYRKTKKPNSRSPITCRWCYDVKRDADNNIILFKARLVAHGYKQVEGVDYNETFSATAQMKSFRMVVAISQLLGLHMTQIDISSAFLHGVLEEEIYMTYPPGYRESTDTCLRLVKGLYGLKQAGRIWNQKFIGTLEEIGFQSLASDSQVLQLRRGSSIFLICLHVDDAILSSNDEALRAEVLAQLEAKFLVKNLGPLSYYLGVRVEQTKEANTLRQDGYIDKMLATFKMEDSKPVDTPGVPGQILTKAHCPAPGSAEHAEMATKPYRQVVGSLMYNYCATRPDIGSILAKVASFANNPGIPHWVASKRILRYLKGTKDLAIQYTGRLFRGDKVTIVAYCDSDWAQCPDDRKSTTGYVVQVGGGPVAWQCKKQHTVALSTTEAEFVAITEATKDVLWVTYFLTELGIEYDTPQIHSDSQSALEWSKNASHHQRNKHVALKYFFIRDAVRDRLVRLGYISTKDNVADILTKPTTRAIFTHLRPMLMGWARKLTSIINPARAA